MILSKPKGYTVVETMMAITLGVVMIASVGSTLDTGIFTAVDNRSRLFATNALREELETLRQTSYDTLLTWGASHSFSNAQVTALQSGAGVVGIANSYGDDIKKVTLTVSWTGRRGQALNQGITTYITRKGLNGS